MRNVKEIITATFILAAVVVVLEHAKGAAQVGGAAAAGYAEDFRALTGH